MIALIETVRIALKSLTRNSMRSALTMLGIVIGVAAVIVMVGVGYGAQNMISSQIAGLGTNMIMISAGSASAEGSLATGGNSATARWDSAGSSAAIRPSRM